MPSRLLILSEILKMTFIAYKLACMECLRMKIVLMSRERTRWLLFAKNKMKNFCLLRWVNRRSIRSRRQKQRQECWGIYWVFTEIAPRLALPLSGRHHLEKYWMYKKKSHGFICKSEIGIKDSTNNIFVRNMLPSIKII